MLTALAVVGVLAVLFLVTALATSDRQALAPAAPDAADLDLPSGEVGADDVRGLRFGLAARGYRMSEVDAALARLADELADRDRRLAELAGGSTASTGEVGAGQAAQDAQGGTDSTSATTSAAVLQPSTASEDGTAPAAPTAGEGATATGAATPPSAPGASSAASGATATSATGTAPALLVPVVVPPPPGDPDAAGEAGAAAVDLPDGPPAAPRQADALPVGTASPADRPAPITFPMDFPEVQTADGDEESVGRAHDEPVDPSLRP